MQQSTRLFHSSISCGCAGIFTPKSGSAFTSVAYRAQRADPRRTRFASLLQQAHIFHAGIKHNLRHTRCAYTSRPYSMTVVSWRMPCFAASLSVVHQKLCSTAVRFPLLGVDVVSAGNMADKVKFWSAQAASMTFQSPAGFAVTSLPCAGHAATADIPAVQSAAVFAAGRFA